MRAMAVCLVFAASGARERSYFLARIELAHVLHLCTHSTETGARSIRARKYERPRGPGAAKTKQTAIARKPQTSTQSDPELVLRCGFALFFNRPSNSRTQESLAFSCLMTLLAAASASRIKQHQTSRALGPPMVRKHQTSSPVVHNNGFLDGFVRRPAKDSTVVDHGARSLMIADRGWA